jgi:16S rRNA C1402 N4-methylase RsmH
MAEKMALYGLRHQRSRLAGQIESLQVINRKNQAKIYDLASRIGTNEAKMDALAAQIEALGGAARLAFNVELANPVSRRTVPKHHFTEWGGVTRELLRQLARANGGPQTTSQLAASINQALKLEMPDEDLLRLQEALRHSLKHLSKKGRVTRASAASTRGDYSTWVFADFVA